MSRVLLFYMDGGERKERRKEMKVDYFNGVFGQKMVIYDEKCMISFGQRIWASFVLVMLTKIRFPSTKVSSTTTYQNSFEDSRKIFH